MIWLIYLISVCSIQATDFGLIQKEISKDWEFRQVRLNNWYPAVVPGVIHMDLIDNGIIEDPFFRLNERGVQWIDKEDWIYRTSFDIDDETFTKNNIFLLFEGLDTYADVSLNGVKILEANNMFRKWRVDVKELIKKSGNNLEIYFHSPLKIDIPKWDALPFQYEAGNDQSENGGVFNKKVSIFARKAGYHYGWDWGPRLVTSGVWRPVYVEAWSDAKLEDVYIKQKNITKKIADLTFEIEICSDRDINDALITISDNDSSKKYKTIRQNLSKGYNKISIDFSIKNPELWWSNGLGKAHLYTFRTEISENDKILSSRTSRTGLRSVKIVRNPDQWGTSFYFELNGIPVFAKGANYIPNDSFLPRVTDSIYRQSILDAVNANMNMLRIWGGGIYEEDVFYELCDENGIMVWQDFMFACSLYPGDSLFLDNVKHEAIDNIKRLRNHPSIAIWCGNNENHLAWFNWGWARNYRNQNPEYAELIWGEYEDLFHKLLPDAVAEYHPESFYWPSSPFSRYDGASDPKHGDYHYWEVWHAKRPINGYNTFKSRFFSEYGFQSFPEFESVKIYAPETEDWNITSEVMMSHQRGGAFANSLIETYLESEYKKPDDFEQFLYYGQLLQGDAIKTAIEAHRRDMPYCMGSLYWQHNDCWPVASWSGRDYYGRWKAQHYFARKAFDDILISPVIIDETLSISIVSDRINSTKGTFEVFIMDMAGNIKFEKRNRITAKANTSEIIFSGELDSFIKDMDKREIFLYTKFTTSEEMYDNFYFFDSQKNINFPECSIRVEVTETEDNYRVITLNSDKFARGVFLSLNGIDYFFEDNYFNMLPDIKKDIRLKTGLTAKEIKEQLRVTHY